MLDLIRLTQEIQVIDTSVKELLEAGTSVDRTEKLGLKVASNPGFYENLRVKMDQTVQRKMEVLDEKSEELEKILRNLMCMSSESPTTHTFEDDSKTVSDYCSELRKYLRSDRSGEFPVLKLHVEQAVRRLSIN